MPGEVLGEGEQPQRLGGRRAVDDDQFPAARPGLLPQLQQGGDLLGAGQGGHLLGDDGIDPEGGEGVDEMACTTSHEPSKCRLPLTCRAQEVVLDLGGRAGARGAQVAVEGVAEGVGGIGRHDEGFDAVAGGRDGRRGRGGLADAALAREEQDGSSRLRRGGRLAGLVRGRRGAGLLAR